METLRRVALAVLLLLVVAGSGCVSIHRAGGQTGTPSSPGVLTAQPVETVYNVKGVVEGSFVASISVNHPVSRVVAVAESPDVTVSVRPLGVTNGVLRVNVTLKAKRSVSGSIPVKLTLIDPDGGSASVFLTVNADLRYPAFGSFKFGTKTLNLGYPSYVELSFVPADGLNYRIVSVSVGFKPSWLSVKPVVSGNKITLEFKANGQPSFQSGIISVRLKVTVECCGVVKEFTPVLTLPYVYEVPKFNVSDYTFSLVYNGLTKQYSFEGFFNAVKTFGGDLTIVYAGVKPPSGGVMDYNMNPYIELGSFKSDKALPLDESTVVKLIEASEEAGISKFYILVVSDSLTGFEVIVTKKTNSSFSKVLSTKAFVVGDKYYVYYNSSGDCSVFPATAGFKLLDSTTVNKNLSVAVFEGSGNLTFTLSCDGYVIKYVVNKTIRLNTTNVVPTGGVAVRILDELGKGVLVLSGNEFRIKTPFGLFTSTGNDQYAYYVFPMVIMKHSPDSPETLSGVIYVPAFGFKKAVVLKKTATLLTPDGELADEYRADKVFVSDRLLGDVAGYLVVFTGNGGVIERFTLDPVMGMYSRMAGWPPENPDKMPFISSIYDAVTGEYTNVTLVEYKLDVGRVIELEKVGVSPVKSMLLSGDYILGVKLNGKPLGYVVLPRYYFGTPATGYATDGEKVFRYTVSVSGMKLSEATSGEPFTVPNVSGVNLPPVRVAGGTVELISPEPFEVSKVLINGKETAFGYLNFVDTVVLTVNGVLPGDKVTVEYPDGGEKTFSVTPGMVAVFRYDNPLSGVFNFLTFVMG